MMKVSLSLSCHVASLPHHWGVVVGGKVAVGVKVVVGMVLLGHRSTVVST